MMMIINKNMIMPEGEKNATHELTMGNVMIVIMTEGFFRSVDALIFFCFWCEMSASALFLFKT